MVLANGSFIGSPLMQDGVTCVEKCPCALHDSFAFLTCWLRLCLLQHVSGQTYHQFFPCNSCIQAIQVLANCWFCDDAGICSSRLVGETRRMQQRHNMLFSALWSMKHRQRFSCRNTLCINHQSIQSFWQQKKQEPLPSLMPSKILL